MRVIVCGGRHYRDRAAVFCALDRLHRERGLTFLAEGACPTGADKWAREWRKSRGVDGESFEADWTRYGKAAGPIRNGEMLHDVGPAGVIAFPGGRGTADMVERADAAGLKVWFPCGRSELTAA